MPTINEAFPSNYIKASDLKGRQVTVKMDRAEFEMMGNDRKLVLYFVGKERGLVLNKTNANNIATAYGDNTDDWHDQEIILFEAMVDFQGKTVPAVRVKIPPRRPSNGNANYELKQTGQFSTGGPRDERSPAPPMRRADDADPDDQIPF